MTSHVPVEPFPPGEYLKDELDARGWTQEDFADVLGMSRRQIINLIKGRSGLSAETALAIGKAFDQDPKFWMNLEVAYELALAAQNQREEEAGIARKAKVYSKVPVRDLRRRGWIGDAESVEALEAAVCEFLAIPNIDASPAFAVAARKSTDYDAELPSQTAWAARAYQLADSVDAAPFKRANFETGLANLRQLIAYPEDARRVPMVLADLGVRLVLVEHLPKSKIDGAAFWLDDSRPAVALSLRHDRIDNFWFTLMHELMHIKHGDRPPVDEDLMSEAGKAVRPEIEKRADEEAADFLIPRDRLESFILRTRPLYYQTRIVQFAQARGIHPGIVVGQLQCKKELKFSQLRPLLVKVREHILGSALTDGWGNCPVSS